MHPLVPFHAATLASIPGPGFSAATLRDGSTAGFALVVVACLGAAALSLLICGGLRSRAIRREHARPLARISATCPEQALIDDLLHRASLGERDGLASLSHPLNHSSDPEVAYAMKLVADQVDPRLVRGILLDRLTERAGDAAASACLSRRRTLLARGGMLLLVAAAAGWWLLSVQTPVVTPLTAASVWAAWCLGGAAWLAASCRGDLAGSRDRHAASAVLRGMLILTAAELIASRAPAAEIERRLRELAGEELRVAGLASAA